MLREPWDVTPLPAEQRTRVAACYPRALADLKKAAAEAGYRSTPVYPCPDEDYTHCLYFLHVSAPFTQWVEAYLQHLAALPDDPTPAVTAESTPAIVLAPAPRGLPLKGILTAAAVAACLLLAFAYWHGWLETGASAGQRAALTGFHTSLAGALAAPEREPADGGSAVPATAPDRPARPEPAPVAPEPEPVPAPASAVVTGNARLTLWVVDVGQGDGLILRYPNGAFVVVDANRNAAPKMREILTAEGCSRLAAMVMTHAHSDHLGDLADLLPRYRTAQFLDPAFPHTSSGYRRLLEAVRRASVPYVTPQSGQQFAWDPRVRTTVLSAGCPPNDDNINNSSIVLHLQFGSTTFLLMGDAETPVENVLLARYPGRLRADVLKAGHHGSATSSSAPFLAAVQPRHAVISCGEGNSFGHPHDKTLRALAAAGTTVWRTDRHSTVMAVSDGTRVAITPARP